MEYYLQQFVGDDLSAVNVGDKVISTRRLFIATEQENVRLPKGETGTVMGVWRPNEDYPKYTPSQIRVFIDSLQVECIFPDGDWQSLLLPLASI